MIFSLIFLQWSVKWFSHSSFYSVQWSDFLINLSTVSSEVNFSSICWHSLSSVKWFSHQSFYSVQWSDFLINLSTVFSEVIFSSIFLQCLCVCSSMLSFKTRHVIKNQTFIIYHQSFYSIYMCVAACSALKQVWCGKRAFCELIFSLIFQQYFLCL